MAGTPLHVFSCVTQLAHKIAKEYYEDMHYVWCSPKFGSDNPPSSTPKTIFCRLEEDICGNDKHSDAIKRNKMGLRKGAKQKCHDGVITTEVQKEILKIVSKAQLTDFSPLIFVISYDQVASLVKKVDPAKRADPFSEELLIEKLPGSDFGVIAF